MKLFKMISGRIGTRTARLIFLLVGAMLTGLTLVFPEVGFLSWVTLVPAIIAIIDICGDSSAKRRGLYGYGFFFFWCYFFVDFHWFLKLYPLEFVDGMTKPAALAVVLLGWCGLPVLQALTAGLSFPILARVIRLTRDHGSRDLSAVAFSALWAVVEWSQTLFWFGVPWARLSISKTFLLVEAQSVSLFGSAALSALIVFVNFTVAKAFIYTDRKRFFAVLAALTVLANASLGGLLWLFSESDGEKVTFAAVQGNISSQEKWNSELTRKTLDVYEQGTVEAAKMGADIVIFPESALPYNIDVYPHYEYYCSRIARENGITVLAGAFTLDENDLEYNSVIAFTPDGERLDEAYSKRRLVPFGEFVPMRDVIVVLVPPLAELSMLSEDLNPGEGAQLFELDGVTVGSLICFDSIYDELARESTLAGAEVLAISTNDSWFLDSAALDMHFAQAKLRAIENGRYIVRSGNTGITGVISSRGEVLSTIEPLTEGVAVGDVMLCDRTTLYTHIGNTFVYSCIGFLFVLCIAPWALKKRKKSQSA